MHLMRTRRQFYSSVYRLDDVVNYFYGYLVPSTAYLNHFGLEEYYEGMLLMMPLKHKPDQLVKVVDQPNCLKFLGNTKKMARNYWRATYGSAESAGAGW